MLSFSEARMEDHSSEAAGSAARKLARSDVMADANRTPSLKLRYSGLDFSVRWESSNTRARIPGPMIRAALPPGAGADKLRISDETFRDPCR